MAENLREKVLTGKVLTGNEMAAEAQPEEEPAAEGLREEELTAEAQPEEEPAAEVLQEEEPTAEALPEEEPAAEVLREEEPTAEGLREEDLTAQGLLQEDLLRGDFEGFYRHTIASVRQYLSSRMADTHEVEDLVQETYAEALEQWNMLREHPNPCGWLLLTAKHICRRYYRRVYTRTEKLYEDSIAVEDPAYDMVVMEDLLHSLYRRDSEKLARAYFLGGSTITELARDMHLSNKSVSNKLYRIRRRLQDEWK